MTPPAAWKRLAERYAALTRRERLLVALAVVLGPLLIGYSLFVEPLGKRARVIENGLAAQTASLAQLQTEAANLEHQLQRDPDAARRADLAALQGERDKLDAQLREFGTSLVRPQDMNGLLERLLARQAGLRLVSLKTLAPQSVLGKDAATREGEAKPVERVFDLYRHGVEIRVEGNFSLLQAYLVQLEKAPQRLLWGPLAYRVVDYPTAEMTLTVYTLSPERTWLAF